MAESDRGIHPDLVDEVQAEREAAETPPTESPRGRSRQRAYAAPPKGPTEPSAGSPVSPNGTSPETGEGDTGLTASSPESGEMPDWRTAASDEEAFKLLAKRLPSEALTKDETLSGLIGSRADIRARDILRQQEREAVERQKREAAASNDLYTLGELTQRDYQQQVHADQQAASMTPLMNVIAKFQGTLDKSIQDEVAGKVFGEGKPWEEGGVEYLRYLVDSATKLGVEAGLRERESALRKSILSEINGNEPVPEREGGTSSRVRVVTDEQIAAMSLAEYDALFDENGHPRPGVQHRNTRGIPLTKQ